MEIDLKELAKRESERVEWKEDGTYERITQSIVKTLSAFANDVANMGGGYVVCGAKEVKDNHGFPTVIYKGVSANKVQELRGRVVQHCLDYVQPSISPIIEELENPDDHTTRILVFISIATQEAHTYRDGERNTHYVRIGNETKEARNGVLNQLLIKKQKIRYFDKRINERAIEEDIDAIAFREYLQEMELWSTDKGLEDYFSDREQIAELVPPMFDKIGLTQTLHPLNFSILLFGKKGSITRLFPDAHTVLSIYKGKDRSEPTAERHIITGSLFYQAKRAIELLNTEAYVLFDKTSSKPNQVKYPIRALQEAVVNAVVHRDYELPEPNRITVFSDRIELRSPGALHWGVDKEKFVVGKASPKWRNQSFAYLFNKMQLAQSEGQGISTIIRTMKQGGCPDPIFELELESVTCILPAHPRHQRIRELQVIQDDIVLQNYESALKKVSKVLEDDPYDFRGLDLLAEVTMKLKRPTILHDFIREKELTLDRINSSTLLNIAKVLTLINKEFTERDKSNLSRLANSVLQAALSGRLEEEQIVDATISLKKVEQPERVIEFIDEAIQKHPRLSTNATLLEKRATSKMDVAKKCMRTARSRHSQRRIKARAWEMCRSMLSEAERDLNAALEHVEDTHERYFIEGHFEFLEVMKEQAKKPNKRRN